MCSDVSEHLDYQDVMLAHNRDLLVELFNDALMESLSEARDLKRRMRLQLFVVPIAAQFFPKYTQACFDGGVSRKSPIAVQNRLKVQCMQDALRPYTAICDMLTSLEFEWLLKTIDSRKSVSRRRLRDGPVSSDTLVSEKVEVVGGYRDLADTDMLALAPGR